jgi:flavin reductase (DIM6/NTAB) family NADH-FMN oxidoreductase RutF
MQFTVYQAADLAQMEKQFRTNFVNSLSGFKNASLVGTISPAGVTNLAIFSQVFHVGANPALIGMLVRPDSVRRDTLTNLLATGYYTLNHVRAEFYQAAHQTSARYDGSEFAATGLHPEFTPAHPAPYVVESHVKIGLKFRERVDLAINGTVLIVGEVVETIIRQDCIATDGLVDVERAGSLACAGLDSYHTTRQLGRLAYAKPHQPSHLVATSYLVPDDQPASHPPLATADTAVETLRRLAEGLRYVSESEHPFVVEKIAIPPAQERAAGTLTIDDFFAPMTTPQPWHGKTEQAQAERFRLLAEAIKAQLGSPTVTKSGDAPTKLVQIVGQVGGEWVRITTQVVET